MKKFAFLLCLTIFALSAQAQFPNDGTFRTADSLKTYIQSEYRVRPGTNEQMKLRKSLRGLADLQQTVYKKTLTIDVPSVAAAESGTVTTTVTGASVGDAVLVGTPATQNSHTNWDAWVSSANVVTIRFNNYSAGAVDPASGSFKIQVHKY